MNHPSMTSHGKQIAAAIAVVVALLLPKRVECGFPGAHCETARGLLRCTRFDTEPLGFFLLESVLGRDVGFAYWSSDDCHS